MSHLLVFLFTMILVPFIGIEVKGAKRWLNFYIFRFQPIEFMKPFFVLVIAQIISLFWIKNLKFSYLLSFIMKNLLSTLHRRDVLSSHDPPFVHVMSIISFS